MIVGLFLLILAQQDSISVHSARPLADAAQQLETKYGVPVFYEDPAWTPAQFPNPGGRPPVFRTYDFAFGFDASQPIVAVLQKIRGACFMTPFTCTGMSSTSEPSFWARR